MQQYPARLIAFSLVSRYFCRRGVTNEIYQRVIHAKDCLFCQTNILNYWHFLPYYFGKFNHILGRLSSNEEKIGIGREDHGIYTLAPAQRSDHCDYESWSHGTIYRFPHDARILLYTISCKPDEEAEVNERRPFGERYMASHGTQ